VNEDWVVTLTFDVDPSMERIEAWEDELEGMDSSVARIPERGVDITVYAPGDFSMFEAAGKMSAEIRHLIGAEPVGVEVVRESERQRRAEAPTMPELMSAAEISEELGISRQRVHQLRATSGFPAPLVELRGGAVWDAAAVRKFDREWSRKPGRPLRVANSVEDVVRPMRSAAIRQVKLPMFGKEYVVSPSRNSREVVPNPDGGWDVKKPGAARASAHYDKQSDAVDRARDILKNDGGGELRTHGRDGKIRSADTIGRKDPYPPKG